MTVIKRFLSLVEITTKLASVFPFLQGVIFVLLVYQTLDLPLTLFFLVAMLVFDMTTTAINNTIDSHRSKLPDVCGFSHRIARVIVAVLLVLSLGLGITLALLTNLVVLLLGTICFFFGIFYTFGPIPINRMPLGELLSGVVMGFLIPLLVVSINVPLISLEVTGWQVSLELDLHMLAALLLYCLPAICTIANIMLCNNICDLDADVTVSRFTLVYYIGKPAAIRLFIALYALAMLAASLTFTMIPLYFGPLTLLIAAWPVHRQLRLFRAEQIKEKTFIVCIRCFLWINLSFVLSGVLSILVGLL